MQQYHKPYGKKVSKGTGGKTRKFKDKKLSHIGGVFAATKVSEKDGKKMLRVRGGRLRVQLKKAAYASVVTKTGMKKVKILGVLESHNPEHVRQNIITRGAVLNTDIGKVRVTNRVGKDGVVNGVQL